MSRPLSLGSRLLNMVGLVVIQIRQFGCRMSGIVFICSPLGRHGWWPLIPSFQSPKLRRKRAMSPVIPKYTSLKNVDHGVVEVHSIPEYDEPITKFISDENGWSTLREDHCTLLSNRGGEDPVAVRTWVNSCHEKN